jgi:hypothetical protein
MQTKRPRPCYDNVEFDLDGHRVVATVIAYDDDGKLIVGNPNWDDVWHVPVESARVVDEPLNSPPADS